jgi:Spy/CpxP family protein refolding chaperone
MNKLLSASAIGLLAIATTALAQPWGGYGPGQGRGWGGPGADVDFRVERMTTMLGLSPAQQDQLRGIFSEQQSQRQAMRQSMRERVDAILTPEQRERHAQLMQGRGFGGPGPGWGGGGGRGLGPCAQGLPPPNAP